MNRVRNRADYTYATAKADIEALIGEIEVLEVAWRASEERVFMDLQEQVRLKHLLRRLRYATPPDAEASGDEQRTYERLLEAVDSELTE